MIQPTNAQQQYPQPGGANAVSINIFQPQAYASGAAPQNNTAQTPAGYNSIYQMPQASAYEQPVQSAQENPYQQYMPVQNPMMQQNPAPVAPAPMMMPNSVLDNQPQQPADAMPAPSQEGAQQAQEQQPANTIQMPQQQAEVSAPAQPVDVEKLLQDLKSEDPKIKGAAINDIAIKSQESPEAALQMVSEPVMNGLVDVINEDTSGLEGPNEQQIEIADKIVKGEELTPEEQAIAKDLSPRDAANTNRILALYTLSMLHRLQKDEINQYIANQQANGQEAIAPVKLNELIGYNDILNVINNDRPEMKVAALEALQHATEPSDLVESTQEEIDNASAQSPEAGQALADANSTIQATKAAVETALKSEDPTVQNAAQETAEILGLAQAQEAQPEQPEQTEQPSEQAAETEEKPKEEEKAA